MRSLPFFLSGLLATGSHALVDLPVMSKVVQEALKSQEIPVASLTKPAPSAPAATTFATVVNSTSPTGSPKINAVAADPGYWLKDIQHQGYAAYNSNPAAYKVFRNVMDYGARGDGVTDDTAAINRAIQDGNRCAPKTCQSTTTTPAIVYFPAGTYVVSTSIIPYYMTQLIGNANSLPVLKATAGFTGLGVIDGDPYQSDGNQGWTSTNVFMRQVRNLVIDLTAIPPATAATGIHWPASQATSLQNVKIQMAQASNSQQQGIFIENGSGGFVTDLEITGGLYGMNIGNQQYTMRNIKISKAVTGISQIWNWGWLYHGLQISDCTTAFSMSNGGSSAQNVGSAIIIDSTITNCGTFVDSAWTTTSQPVGGGGLMLENVALSNVPVAVKGPSGTVLNGGTTTIANWGQGKRYTPNGPQQWQGTYSAGTRPAGLLSGGKYYTKSKPQYADQGTGSFVSARSSGAKGDGNTDDTTALQNAINSAKSANKILFIDHGVYKVTNTLYFPPGSRIVGETYSVIMAAGSTFSSKTNPVPVIQIGKSGESGSIEWSDMVVSTQGSAPGAKLIEWNLAASSGSGMWDVHTRVGGARGTNQQVGDCPTGAAVQDKCLAAYMSMHITKTGSGAYLENNWLWTADHDLDDASSTRVSIYTGRGLLVEGSNTWLWATGVEHHALYQYHFSSAKSVFAGFIQTETPYWQPVPDAKSQPYPLNTALNDPNYSQSCQAGNCDALGLRILNSQDIRVYGAGLYSFFNNYSTKCSDKPTDGGTGDCQSEIFRVEGSSTGVAVYGLNTIGTLSMAVVDGSSKIVAKDNYGAFTSMVSLFSKL